jgi:hypothetical protein
VALVMVGIDMKRLLLVAGALMALQASSASASTTTFDWSYSGPGVSGSGTFDATYIGGGDTFVLDSIAGTISGPAGDQSDLALSGYDGPDQIIFYPDTLPDVAVDRLGFSFSVGDGTSYNLYEDDDGYPIGNPYHCGVVYCLLGPGDTFTGGAGDPVVALDSFNVTYTGGVVPEPATWAMMLVGFGGLGAAMRSRRKTLATTA